MQAAPAPSPASPMRSICGDDVKHMPAIWCQICLNMCSHVIVLTPEGAVADGHGPVFCPLHSNTGAWCWHVLVWPRRQKYVKNYLYRDRRKFTIYWTVYLAMYLQCSVWPRNCVGWHLWTHDDTSRCWPMLKFVRRAIVFDCMLWYITEYIQGFVTYKKKS